MSNSGLIASIKQRLLNQSKETGEDFNFLLSRYGVERLLYRMSISKYNENFILKGAMLFYVWNQNLHRPTRDVDFLGLEAMDPLRLKKAFQAISQISAHPDGLSFLTDSITAAEIRENNAYGGIRVKLTAKLGNSKIPIQIDVGYGDAITPEAVTCDFPSLLPDLPTYSFKTYPVYTVIAEKFEAMVTLGDQNSRLKDFFDLHYILKHKPLDKKLICKAIRATFSRRKTELPKDIPLCLTEEFAINKDRMWKAFLRRNQLPEKDFLDITNEIMAALPSELFKDRSLK